jgi:hypothetical protein
MTHYHSPRPQGPFGETEPYLDELIDRCTENAIRRSRQQRRRKPLVIALALTAAASVAVLIAVGAGWLHLGSGEALPMAMQQTTTTSKQAHDTAKALRAVTRRSPTVLADTGPVPTSNSRPSATTAAQPAQPSPLDEFLEGIDDEEAEVLAYSTMEDIPEY